VLERLNLQMVASQFISFMQNTDLDESQQAHEELLKAIQTGDGDKAELIMRLHVKRGREFALSCVPRV
jgi:DNA-binding GntR family transcriptional regulator